MRPTGAPGAMTNVRGHELSGAALRNLLALADARYWFLLSSFLSYHGVDIRS